jgi:integrase
MKSTFLTNGVLRRAAKPLTYEEQAVAPPLLLTLIVLLTDTGLRVRKEALPLRWEDVDLSVGVLYVRKSKTPAGRRAVPLTEHSSMILRKWMRVTGPEFSPYVFANPRNPATYLKSVRKTWARALKAANLEWRPIYDLRATFASRLSAEGAPDALVAEMLGHSSPSIVGTYVKVLDEAGGRLPKNWMMPGVLMHTGAGKQTRKLSPSITRTRSGLIDPSFSAFCRELVPVLNFSDYPV